MLRDDQVDWYIVYQALIHAIRTNSGIGFHNGDQGHMAYVLGASDGRRDSAMLGDAPEENKLYRMLVALSETYGNRAGPPVPNWRAFCELAVEGYNRSRQRTAS